jgi:ABC-type uncharacterized transport system permease subunit
MMPVPVLAFLHFGSVPVWAYSITGTGIYEWFQYRYWNLYFGSLTVLAWVITGTGIHSCPFRYWHFGTLVQYQYRHIPLPVLAFNIARTGNRISALWFSTVIGTFHYWYWHSKMVPVLVQAFMHFGSVPV